MAVIRLPDPPDQFNREWAAELTRVLQILVLSMPNFPANKAPYTTANVTTTRALDADSTTLAEVADVLCSLVEDLKANGTLHGKTI
jgi:hypothetical protein